MRSNDGERAVVLLSGGLDSTTVLAIASRDAEHVTALSFSYGQMHTVELRMAAKSAARFAVDEHLVIDLDPEPFKGSSLTGHGEIPCGDDDTGEIPSTYVPARNTIFLSMALGIAEARCAGCIYIGVNSLDYSGYPDCRPEYIDAFQRLADLATKQAVQGNPPVIHAPLMSMTKAEIIKLGTELGVDYRDTVSCYRASQSGLACGMCDSCRIRLRAFSECGIKDPAAYADS